MIIAAGVKIHTKLFSNISREKSSGSSRGLILKISKRTIQANFSQKEIIRDFFFYFHTKFEFSAGREEKRISFEFVPHSGKASTLFCVTWGDEGLTATREQLISYTQYFTSTFPSLTL